MNRRHIIALAIIVVVSVAAGTTYWYLMPKPLGQISLKIFIRDMHETDMLRFANEYMQLNPNIKITTVSLGFTGLYEKLQTALIGEEEVDIMPITLAWVHPWAKLGYIRPIDEYLQKYPINKSDYKEGGYDAFAVAGQQFGLPWRASGETLTYDVEAFEEAGLPLRGPETWEELLDWARELTKYDKDGNVIRYGFGESGNPLMLFFTMEAGPYAWGQGSSLVSTDLTTCNLNKTEWKNTVEYIRELDKYTAPGVFATAVADLPNKFIAGTIAMTFASSMTYDAIKKLDPNFKVGLARYPAGSAGYDGVKTNAVVWSWVFPKAGQHPDEAFKFVHWLQQDPHRMALVTPELPATYSAGYDAKFNRFKEANYTMYGLLSGGDTAYLEPAYYHLKGATIVDIAAAALSQLISNPTLDIQTTLDQATAEIYQQLRS